jgi:shikimate kinase
VLQNSIKVFLIGLPGSGKTTLARQVSGLTQLSFYDLDEEIEKVEGVTVGEIFLDKGEEGFRKMETSSLTKFCHLSSGFVMATGGGVPCFNNNMELMLNSGTVIFLNVPTEEISKRIVSQSIDRPLLKGTTALTLQDKISSIRNARIKFYQKAHHTLTGNQIEAKKIIDLLSL